MYGVLWGNRNTVLAGHRVERMGHRIKKEKESDFHTLCSLPLPFDYVVCEYMIYKTMKERKAFS